jgi:hypothetical protein
VSLLPALVIVLITLSSCHFECKLSGPENASAEKSLSPVFKDGAAIYNGIELETRGVKLSKAYLILDDGKRVPEGNIVDFSVPVKLILQVDSGWVAREGKVMLGASEKLITGRGDTVLDEKDLFSEYTAGIAEADSKTVALTINIHLGADAAPEHFIINFKVWDKIGSGIIEGRYRLYSR